MMDKTSIGSGLCATMYRTALAAAMLIGAGCGNRSLAETAVAADIPEEPCIHASVVAMDQPYAYNRFGSYNPIGMVFALRRDVVVEDTTSGGSGRQDQGKPIQAQPSESAREAELYAGKVRLREDKRPRPLVLRVNEGGCLEVTFTNLLRTWPQDVDDLEMRDRRVENGGGDPPDSPGTRKVGLQVNGLAYMRTGRPDDGLAPNGRASLPTSAVLAAPGETRTYRWHATRDGTYLLHSSGGPVGGEGDGGLLGLGLFGAVNVEPQGSKWYRSQVSAAQLKAVTAGNEQISFGGRRFEAKIDYDARDAQGVPILGMLDGQEIVHSDLNAVVELPAESERPGGRGSFREFTTIFHDELTVLQAYPELANEDSPLSSLRDGMGINYGSSGLGAMVLAVKSHEGPGAQCVECKLEEFFLTSWVNGDPALVLREKDGKLASPYSDDPSNVHHSYLGDSVRFRNLHAGPKETHVFHLHAHQWLFDNAGASSESEYNDSQTISPGAAFTYNIAWGGSGNRNLTPGDSIFHCHLYPHFAQGMWELWRSHDVFEDGTNGRWLPDADDRLAGAKEHRTPTPAVVPLPRQAMPPLPTAEMPGYPFYIAGTPGHRPPQPPLDMAVDEATGEMLDGGLPRHVVLGGDAIDGPAAVLDTYRNPSEAPDHTRVSVEIARRVAQQNGDLGSMYVLAHRLASAQLALLPASGTGPERLAMDFHAGRLTAPGESPPQNWTGPDSKWEGAAYLSCSPEGICDSASAQVRFAVNGRSPAPGAPYADPCPNQAWDDSGPRPVHTRRYRAAYLQYDNSVNRAGWHDPQTRSIVLENDIPATLRYERPAEPLFFRANSGECIEFQAVNLIPSNLNLDDFQVFSPTDTIGEHIHLVKFDVTSSDGSANGWNYEDATFSAEEVRERIAAYNRWARSAGITGQLSPKTHRLFRSGAMAGDARGVCPSDASTLGDDVRMNRDHPWCGAQSSVQRWWADPTTDPAGKDRTLRTVFTHDHLGPSSHQQHGLYAALLVEPKGSTWETPGGELLGGSDEFWRPLQLRPDGGPTSYAANILPVENCGAWSDIGCRSRREFAIAFADYALLYTRHRPYQAEVSDLPVNPPSRFGRELPYNVVSGLRAPRPEGISTKDPGSQLLNYRNEPLPVRLGEEQADGTYRLRREIGDKANPLCRQAAVEPWRRVLRPSEGLVPTLMSCAPGDAMCLASICDRADPANALSSLTHIEEQSSDPRFPFTGAAVTPAEPAGVRRPGDPATPILGVFENDPVQIRLIQGAQEENHTFILQGGKWLHQPNWRNSGYTAAQPIGISEHFEFEVRTYKGEAGTNVDQLYGASAVDDLWNGQWGLMRIFDARSNRELALGLKALPDRLRSRDITGGELCTAPVQYYRVEAWNVRDLLARRDPAAPPLPADANVSAQLGLIYAKRDQRGPLHDPDAIVFLAVKAGKAEPAVEPADTETAAKAALDVLAMRHWRIDPLVLRANAGDCVIVDLVNRLPPGREQAGADGHLGADHWTWNAMPPITQGLNLNQLPMSRQVGLVPQLVMSDQFARDGSHIGYNLRSSAPYWQVSADPDQPPQTPSPRVIGNRSESIRYRWYAGERRLIPNEAGGESWKSIPIEFGAVSLADYGDPIKHGSHGAIGALVIEPQGATWCQGDDQLECLGVSATVTYPTNDGEKGFREVVLLYQDELALRWNGAPLENLRSGDDAEDTGGKGVNYRTDPLWSRLGSLPSLEPNDTAAYDQSDVFADSPGVAPDHPVFQIPTGDDVRIRVVHPSGHPRQHALTVVGHHWSATPWDMGSTRQCAVNPDASLDPQAADAPGTAQLGTLNGIGPRRHANLLVRAGGERAVPGDYLIRTQDAFTFNGGVWAVLRATEATLTPLRDRICEPEPIRGSR